ncbi:MAG: lysostaphin resistance A-like protein [Betaproteobacteria bacterium]
MGWFAVAILAALLPLAAWRDAARRGYALAAVAGLLLFLSLREAPLLLPGPRWLGEHWNWSGWLLAVTGVLLLAATLVRQAGLRWGEFGLTLTQRSGSVGPALLVTLAALLLNLLLMAGSSFRLPAVPTETWLFQASLPGLVEETVFRGVLLALADRALAPRWPRWNVGGAPIGLGGLWVTLLFVALHGASVHMLTGVLPAALLYLWLRARTGSLVAPILAHNAWNLSVYLAHS